MANKKADFKLTEPEVTHIAIPEVKKMEPSPPEERDHVFLSMEYMSKHRDDIMLTDSQKRISEIIGAMKDLLLYKNQKYGDSALKPICIFTKHIKTADTSTASILVRLDDKLSRVKNADVLRKNDISDIIGYCTLLLISMGVTAEDIAKFKD